MAAIEAQLQGEDLAAGGIGGKKGQLFRCEHADQRQGHGLAMEQLERLGQLLRDPLLAAVFPDEQIGLPGVYQRDLLGECQAAILQKMGLGRERGQDQRQPIGLPVGKRPLLAFLGFPTGATLALRNAPFVQRRLRWIPPS